MADSTTPDSPLATEVAGMLAGAGDFRHATPSTLDLAVDDTSTPILARIYMGKGTDAEVRTVMVASDDVEFVNGALVLHIDL